MIAEYSWIDSLNSGIFSPSWQKNYEKLSFLQIKAHSVALSQLYIKHNKFA